MRDDVRADLNRFNPGLKTKVATAPGYTAFDNLNAQTFVLGSGHGYGLTINNATGGDTFMRKGELGAGTKYRKNKKFN